MEVDMKRLILTFGALIATVVFLGMPVQAETVAVNRTIEIPGASKEMIFEKASKWSGKYFSDYKADKTSGVIQARGEITYPSPPVDRIQYTFVFKMKNTVQDNRVAVSFEEVMLKSPETYLPSDTGAGPLFTGGEVAKVESKDDIAAANRVLSHVADNLEANLKDKSDAACPLVKCPECAVLCPSSEEMKEHMKGHPGQETAPKR
jgi:hypothetical protein